MEILSKNVKKIHPWSNGFGVYITKEAKEFGWDQNTHVKLSAVEEDGEKKIVIEKVDV